MQAYRRPKVVIFLIYADLIDKKGAMCYTPHLGLAAKGCRAQFTVKIILQGQFETIVKLW
jgi:hypothetical protein